MEENRKMSPEERRRGRFINKNAAVSAKYLRKLQELSCMPEAMTPFIETLDEVLVKLEDIKTDDGIKTIGTYCVMVPQELVYAAGAVDVKLCSGSITAFGVGDDISPRDACPLVKAVAGFEDIKKLPLYENCSLMVVPITCDCKKKLASVLAESCNVYTMQVPSNPKKDTAIEEYVEQLKELITILEKATGNPITYDGLKAAINLIGEAQYEFTRFIKFKKSNRILIRGTHALAVVNAYSYMPADRWTKALRTLNDELEKREKEGFIITKKKQPRILLTGSPVVFPNIKIPMLIDEMGGSVVADETCMGDRFMYDPVVITDTSFDGLLHSLANRYLRPCSCPVFPDNEKRIYRLKQMIKDYKVEGVVYHVLRGCLVFDFEYQLVEKLMSELDIPIIRVETDYNEEDIEQLRIRIEAFMELIKMQKR